MKPTDNNVFGLSPQTVRENNSRLVELFSLYLNLMPRAVEPDAIEALAKDCNIPLAEAFAHYLAALAGIDAGGADRIFFQSWLLPSISLQDPTPFLTDAYFKSIKIPDKKLGKWELKHEKLTPFEGFVAGDFVVKPDGRMLPQIGFFKESYAFPAVLENGREWMTLLPNELVTTWPAMKKAHGRVLTYGLGLGYFTYHAAEKENVSEVTVVDVSDDVISLFKEHILPQFPHKEKVRLVKMDAFEFADTKMEGRFDFVFGDIWHDAGDGRELYLKMKEWETRFPDIDFAFWLEDTIKCYLDESLWDIPK